MIVSEIFTTLIAGGATGILGTGLSAAFSFFKSRQQNKLALEMRAIDLDEMRLEGELHAKAIGLQLEVTQIEAQNRALLDSYKGERTFISKGMDLTPAQQWVVVFIDLIRGLMRPAITVFFLLLMYKVHSENALPQSEEIMIIKSIIYMTTTSVLWWFGSRQLEKHVRH